MDSVPGSPSTVAVADAPCLTGGAATVESLAANLAFNSSKSFLLTVSPQPEMTDNMTQTDRIETMVFMLFPFEENGCETGFGRLPLAKRLGTTPKNYVLIRSGIPVLC